MSHAVLLCGLGQVGWRVLESLKHAGASITVIDLKAKADDPRLHGITFFQGDCKQQELLDKAGARTATGILIVTSDDLLNVSTAMLVRGMNPTARIVVRMFNQNLVHRLGNALRNTVALSVSALTAPLMALTAISGEALAAFSIADSPQQVAEVVIDVDSALVGEPLTDVAARFRVLVISQEFPSDQRLSKDDRFVVCGDPKTVGELLALASGTFASGVEWAGKLRRWARTVRRTLGEIDTSMKLASLALFGVVFASSLVFRFGTDFSWGDSIYSTVSVVATGSDLKGDGQREWVKVFLSVLKLLGAALVAGFTAIFTNYLLKAKLGGAFEMRRIPDGGHVVVCGLGNIGFRCVEHLLKLGYQVVAIDQKSDSPFVPTVRRMGAAVLHGDATMPEVLKQAGASKARAVIAATSSELANLEIALLIRELNPEQRVIVRLADPEFAQAMRDAADLKYAMSTPALAAPAFAAALLGDRVQAMITVGVRTMAICEVVIQAGDGDLVDHPLQELMIDYHFLPIGIAGQPTFAESGIPKGYRMKAGDHLMVVAELLDLERLVRRAAPEKGHSVLVEDFPLTASDALLPILRASRNMSAEEADALLAGKSFVMGEGLSRGQAEELHARVTREKARATIVHPKT